jgi:hypothetical protein
MIVQKEKHEVAFENKFKKRTGICKSEGRAGGK